MEDNKRKYNAIEIEIAKNLLAKGYKWIARDKNDTLCAYKDRAVKKEKEWLCERDWLYGRGWSILIGEGNRGVIPLFDNINWTDSEPVSLRDIVPQILTDEEREWLRTVVKPFRDRLKEVKVYDGVFYGRYRTAIKPSRYITFIIDPPEARIEDIEENVEYMAIPVSEDGFEGMEHYKHYTPEELDI